MLGKTKSLVFGFLLLSLSLSGCLSDSSSVDGETISEQAEITASPCLEPSSSVTQTMVSNTVNGEERSFRLSAPSSDAGTKLAVIIAFHGGGGAEEDFQQQSEFDQLGEEEKFIMAYAIAEDGRTSAEGEWYLNTAATSREDNDFTEAIVDELPPSEKAVPVLNAYSVIVIVTDVVPEVEESAPETLEIDIVAVSDPSFTVSEVGLNVAVPVVAPALIVISSIAPLPSV